MHYDSEMLHWNGLVRDSVLGLSDPLALNGSVKEHIIRADWRNTKHGEFRKIFHLNKEMFPDYFEGTGSMSAAAQISWNRPKKGKLSFRGGSSTGFVKDPPRDLEIFVASFTPKPGFRAGESTRISFLVNRQPSIGSEYDFRAKSVTITNKGSPPPE